MLTNSDESTQDYQSGQVSVFSENLDSPRVKELHAACDDGLWLYHQCNELFVGGSCLLSELVLPSTDAHEHFVDIQRCGKFTGVPCWLGCEQTEDH